MYIFCAYIMDRFVGSSWGKVMGEREHRLILISVGVIRGTLFNHVPSSFLALRKCYVA